MARDIVRRKGAAAFGTRLRRLSERIDRDVQALYRAHGVAFEPRWFPVVVALDEFGPMSVGELAASLGVSHAAISQVRRQLVEHGLVRASCDSEDRRRQVLALTRRGCAKVEHLRPIWSAVTAATRSLCVHSAPRLLAEIQRLEAALDVQPLFDRIHARLVGRRRRGATATKGG